MDQHNITIYTDGSCIGNPGPGGWAAILMCGEREKIISGNDKDTTNNRMELTAVIEGLACVESRNLTSLFIPTANTLLRAPSLGSNAGDLMVGGRPPGSLL